MPSPKLISLPADEPTASDLKRTKTEEVDTPETPRYERSNHVIPI